MKHPNKLLERQIKRHLKQLMLSKDGVIQKELESFLDAVNQAYMDFNSDLQLAQHSLEVSSQELFEENQQVQEKSRAMEVLNSALVVSEGAYRAVFDNSPAGIGVLNSKFECLSMNLALQEFLGCPADELLGRKISDFIHPENSLSIKESFQHHLSSQGQFERVEIRFVHKYKSEIWGLVSSKAVKNDTTNEVTFFTVVEDISAIKKKDQEYQIAQAKMVASSRMAELGEMASGIAHEINNPLTVIQGKTSFLVRQIGKGSLTEQSIISDLQKIHKTCDRIAKIIRSLKTFSRDSQGDPLTPEPLKDIIAETVELCQERIQSQSIDLRLKVIGDPVINCRRGQIAQVLLNLITNAYDVVMDLPERWIEVVAAEQNGRVHIKVTDAGRGISPDVLHKIMQPFFTTKPIGKGTGLGLSISLNIILDHGGKLSYVADNPNTCFLIDLPAAELRALERAS